MTVTRALLGACLLLPLIACGDSGGPPPAVSDGDSASPPLPNEGPGDARDEVPETVAWTEALGTATVTGKVEFRGEAPERELLDMSSDPKCAAEGARRETVVVADGGLANCVVSVTKGLEEFAFEDGSGAVPVDQRGCRYRPHVLALQAGQTLRITNSDPTVHNVNASPKRNPPFNLAQPEGAPPIERELGRKDKLFPIKCDMHAWMSCHVAVFEHPFFTVSDAGGSFTLPQLPAGSYTLTAEHESLGKRTAEVTVASGATAEATFTFEK